MQTQPRFRSALVALGSIALPAILPTAALRAQTDETKPVPPAIHRIMGKPRYAKARWGLRVVDLDSGRLIYNLDPDFEFQIASVRKLFSIGVALDELGADHKFSTPVYRCGEVQGGVLKGDLILVASGDLTLGGRTTRRGEIAFTSFDHTEANALGSAILTKPNPLAGLDELARQVAASGIKALDGDVIIDDRLFVPFNYRGELDVRPIVINDDLIDVTILPTKPGKSAEVLWRPHTAAFAVYSSVNTRPAGEKTRVILSYKTPGSGHVSGTMAQDFVPSLPGVRTLVQTFRIKDQPSFARIAFIEALQRAGVMVGAALSGLNPLVKLPSLCSYEPSNQVADLGSLPYSEYAKLILKVSHNLGADLSLVLFGLAKGVNNLSEALIEERETLAHNFGIPANSFHFIDGSGAGETTATTTATLKLLDGMTRSPAFDAFFDALPRLAVDGSLAEINDFQHDPELTGATGQVYAKPGTLVEGPDDLLYKTQTLAGYIDTKSGKRLMFAVFVNNAGVVKTLDDILAVFNDEGTIAATIWKEN